MHVYIQNLLHIHMHIPVDINIDISHKCKKAVQIQPWGTIVHTHTHTYSKLERVANTAARRVFRPGCLFPSSAASKKE